VRIGIQTWGSDGDILPLLALGHELAACGHTVAAVLTSVDDKDYVGFASGLGVTARQVPERTNCDLPALLRQGYALRNPAARMKLMVQAIFEPFCESMLAAAHDLAAACDVLVGHVAMYPLHIAARKTGTPYASVTLWPGMIPSDCYAPYPLPSLGAWGNRVAWRAAHWITDRLFLGEMNPRWTHAGLAPRRHMLGDAVFSEDLSLVAASPALWPAPPDWDGQHVLCGAFVPPPVVRDWSPAPGLAAFLAEGEAPVYVGLGSMQQTDPEGCAARITTMLRTCGCRALVQAAGSPWPAETRAGSVYHLGRAPHAEVLPRCRAAVIHGGAGTAHAVLRAGLPALVVGFMEEQLSWGQTLHQRGVGVRPLFYPRARASAWARRLQELLANPGLRQEALRLSEVMAREDGVGTAAARIERLGTQRDA